MAAEIPEDHLEQVRREFPRIEPHRERDWDWRDRGTQLLEEGNLTGAERQFKQLILSQPEHHDGFEGLALTYKQMGRKQEALFLMQEALARAGRSLADGLLDPGALE